jgi:hypothetical protein
MKTRIIKKRRDAIIHKNILPRVDKNDLFFFITSSFESMVINDNFCNSNYTPTLRKELYQL